ncbi:oligosaccharide repeat unit polymerase [Bacillus sp. S70]|uniref:O-antigen polymerase n=1 Tax=unclassified Bacillus (in: firmicutes) TaxID=185979 RepID=UPI00190ACDBF|nr:MULTISPECIES: O-antigen polymerase [unclassified Bacillus (in: firmicutes)]MBJ9983223.1 oligosaccharide repeat unit polymerase [Bacillus sp. S29]MBK0102093.1 oligosaccharide repeat unit polymerase [Bacillus sp. S70]MBK0107447.1 oligosaccharide repeat unit polymerase [Bacillus sp. S73]MBK0136357.1 oligosaccharide repeat unit polymerase [Bacillus sp. S72]MBK0148906.1 oligosaccharide repeat unit polymerase [Bacillus sp. S74]
MWKLIGTVFCIILIIVIVVFEARRPKKNINNRFDLLSGINVIYVFCYGIIPICLLNLDFSMLSNHILDSLDMEKENFLFASVLSIIGYVSILVGYYYKNIVCKLTRKPIKYNDSLYNQSKSYNVSKFSMVVFTILIFAIGSVSLIQYVNNLGGFSQAIRVAEVLRMYTDTNKFSNPYAVMLMPLIIASCTMFYVLNKLEHSLLAKIIYQAMFIVTFTMSIYYYLLNAGRLPLFIFLSSFIILGYIMKEKKSIKANLSIIIVVLLGVFILQNLDDLFSYLAFDTVNKEDVSALDKFKKNILEFSFPYVNLVKVHSFTYPDGTFRYFVDYFTWLVNIIPTSILNVFGADKVMSSHLLNTANYNLVNIAGIPVDLVSLGYYQFSVPGVVITCSLFGVIATSVEDFLQKFTHPAFMLIKIRIMYLCIFCVMYADPDVIARGRLDVTIIILFLVLFSRVSSNKEKNGKFIKR